MSAFRAALSSLRCFSAERIALLSASSAALTEWALSIDPDPRSTDTDSSLEVSPVKSRRGSSTCSLKLSLLSEVEQDVRGEDE